MKRRLPGSKARSPTRTPPIERAGEETAGLKDQIADKDAAIERADEETAGLKGQIADKDAAIERAGEETTGLKDQIADRDAVIERAGVVIAGLKDEVADKDAAIEDPNRQPESMESAQPTPATISRLETVRERGILICGGRDDVVGFGFLDAAGRNVGFDIDLCRAVAAAVLGDPNAIEVLVITAAERGAFIQSGEVDMLVRTVAWTTSRDSQWGNYAQTMFFDGQGFMVHKDLGISSALELKGTTVCVTHGTSTELNLHDFSNQNNLNIEVRTFVDTDAVVAAYGSGLWRRLHQRPLASCRPRQRVPEPRRSRHPARNHI